MKAVLLCAGFGTRMYPLTRDRAKPLLPVRGKPIVERLADQLEATGAVDELIVVSNARFYDDFVAWSGGRARILGNGVHEPEALLGAVRDLKEAVDQVGADESLVVAAGDNLFRNTIDHVLVDYDDSARNLILTYYEPDPEKLSRTGVATIGQDGRLERLVEKPTDPESQWACPAFYILEPDALAELGPYLARTPNADALGGFIAWIAERCEVFTHEMVGQRLDVGDLDGYANAESWLEAGE